MEKVAEFDLEAPVYKVVREEGQPYWLFVSVNSFFVFDPVAGTWKQFVVDELEVILDIAWGERILVIAGIGGMPVVFDLRKEHVTGTVAAPVAERIAYSVVKIIEKRLFAANVYTGMIEVWDMQTHRKVEEFLGSDFVKQLLWDADSRTLIVAVAETEDTGFLLFNHIDRDGRIRSLDVTLNCYFSVSKICFSKDKKELFIAGGYPPLNVQVHSYPDLKYTKEFVLAEDYPHDEFGNDIGYAFNIDFQLIAGNEMIFPYSGGDLFLINYVNNTYKRIHSDEYQWIYAKIAGELLLAVSHEGMVRLYKNEFGGSEEGRENEELVHAKGPAFPTVSLTYPLIRRKEILPEKEDADELEEIM